MHDPDVRRDDNNKTQIRVAIIGLIGTLGAAAIALASSVLPRADPELPAVPVLADPHVGRRPGRVADLLHPAPAVQRPVGAYVDHEPVLRPAEALLAGADRGADQAARRSSRSPRSR